MVEDELRPSKRIRTWTKRVLGLLWLAWAISMLMGLSVRAISGASTSWGHTIGFIFVFPLVVLGSVLLVLWAIRARTGRKWPNWW